MQLEVFSPGVSYNKNKNKNKKSNCTLTFFYLCAVLRVKYKFGLIAQTPQLERAAFLILPARTNNTMLTGSRTIRLGQALSEVPFWGPCRRQCAQGVVQGKEEGTGEGQAIRPEGQGAVQTLHQVQWEAIKGFAVKFTSQRSLGLLPGQGEPSGWVLQGFR